MIHTMSTLGISHMSFKSLAKVSKDDIELAMDTYTVLSSKAKKELDAKVHEDLIKSGMTHVGMLWWKKEITDDLYIDYISGDGMFGIHGEVHIFTKYCHEMTFAPLFYMQSCNRLVNRYSGFKREISALLKASSTEYLYLSKDHCEWLSAMLEHEDIILR